MPARLRRLATRLRVDRRAVAFLEFALILPLFLGFVVAGLEFGNLMLSNMRVQRLATMTADMVAQRGASETPISELQMYDILSAIDIAASPLDMAGRGRVMISAVLGEDINNDTRPDLNRTRWQRFSGGYTEATPIIGCWRNSDRATLRHGKQLSLNEAMFFVQVSYRYEPFFLGSLVSAFDVPAVITRTAAYRGRGSTFKGVSRSDGYPPKDNCATANGL